MIEINNADIAYAEKLLLPEGCSFNDERRAFIQCMESRDVVACPGSGKTTALLAKLLILARKMPFEDDRGICVLTHTNAAIDLIKDKAGIASDALFRHPNFFGTIQHFVDRFLTEPWYRNEFQKSVIAIDNDRFYSALGRLYRQDYGLQQYLEHQGGIEKLGNFWFHPHDLEVGTDLDRSIDKPGRQTKTFEKIQEIRRRVLAAGFLNFHDAYSLALRYLIMVPQICDLFGHRFSMIFLDETQDTSEYQFRILNQIFSPETLIIQKIGDPNQAIYDELSSDKKGWYPENPLLFSDSRRYGDTICHLLSSVRDDDSIELKPCVSSKSIAPYLLTFQPGEEEKVICAFAHLIDEVSNDLPRNGPYKAIGRIAKKNDERLCLPTYFPDYKRPNRAISPHFENLTSYSEYAIGIASNGRAKEFFDVILEGINRALFKADIKEPISQRNYTSSMLCRYWEQESNETYYAFRKQIAACFLQALDSKLYSRALNEYIISFVKPVWPGIVRANAFLEETRTSLSDNKNETPIGSMNIYKGPHEIQIDIGTVHSVKGETHCATLYVDTEYYGPESKRLIDFLQGNRPKSLLNKPRHQGSLRVAHVAFSRPTHLVAFACRESSVSGHEDALRKFGWEIRRVSDLLTMEKNDNLQ